MSVVHKVTGYDRRTDKLEQAFDLPQNRFTEISELVKLPASYEHLHGAFPLDHNSAWQLSMLLNIRMNVDHYHWFIEPFEIENMTAN